MTINPKQFPVVEAGTNCLTQAEDRVAQVLRDSPAFHTFCGVADSTAAESHLFIDEANGPADYAFTLEEIEKRGSSAKVFADPNEGTVIENGSAGNTIISTNLLVCLERFVPATSERDLLQQQRVMKNLAIPVGTELFDGLKARYGQRYIQRIVVQHPRPLVEVEEEEMLGVRTGSVLVLEMGPGDAGG